MSLSNKIIREIREIRGSLSDNFKTPFSLKIFAITQKQGIVALVQDLYRFNR